MKVWKKPTFWLSLLTVVAVIVLVVIVISDKKDEALMDEKKLSQPVFIFSQVEDFYLSYGYDFGLILEADIQKTILLLYNVKNETMDDLIAKRIDVNHKLQVENTEDVKLSEELLGYSIGFKFGNSAQKKYLLGIRSKVDPDIKKLYSDLFVMDKEKLEHMTVLQSYAFNYDPSIGRIPQGDIPVSIDFTVEMIGDYIVYQDADMFWKVQDVRSGEIYTSDENETSLEKVQIYYQEEGQDCPLSDQYIYILKYYNDNSILAFDKSDKNFIKIEAEL